MVSAMSVHSATGHDLHPIGLTCCEITIGRSQIKNISIMCNKITEELVIGLDMQQLHHLGCAWAYDEVFTPGYGNTHYLQRCCHKYSKFENTDVQIPAHCIAAIQTKLNVLLLLHVYWK